MELIATSEWLSKWEHSGLVGIEIAGAIATIATVVITVGRWPFTKAQLYFQRRKAIKGRLRELTEELRHDGYPALKQLGLGGAALKVLAESFSLQVPDDVPDDEKRYDGTTILKWIAEQDIRRFIIRADGGSGKTTFGMLLAASWPRFCPQLPVFYIPPSDLAGDAIDTKKIDEWLRLVSPGPVLLILDALDEIPLKPVEIVQRIDEVSKREGPSKVQLLLMFRPQSAKYADAIGRLLLTSDRPPPEISLVFDMDKSVQCSFYCYLFVNSQRTPEEVRFILGETFNALPYLRLTREAALAILTDREDRIRNPNNSPPFFRSPWAGLFRHVTMGSGSKLTGDVKAIALRAMDLIGSGKYTSWFTPCGRDEAKALRSVLESKRNLALRLKSRSGRFCFPKETHLSALAAIHIAETIQLNPQAKDAVSSLKDLRGTMAFDDCAKFLVPAFRAVRSTDRTSNKDALKVIQFLEALIHTDLGNPPYSFCAHVLCDSLDSELLPVFERRRIDSSLFKRLLLAIDEDRLRTCEASILAEAQGEGPNPILDQLFEVFRVYDNRAVKPCLDVLLSRNDPTFCSQGAYMLLSWVEARLPSESQVQTDRQLIASRERLDEEVYDIVERLSELRHETNLHVCFHAVEVLEQVRAAYEQGLLTISSFEALFKSACAALSDFDAESSKFEAVPEGIRRQYLYARQLVSTWSEYLSDLSDLGNRSAPYRWTSDVNPAALVITTDEAAFLAAYKSEPNSDCKQALESVLELREASLGILRRLYCFSDTPPDALPIAAALKSPAWVVRWWAFYNMFQVICARKGKNLAANYFDSFAEEFLASGEPMGLKHRQCRLVDRLLDTLKDDERNRKKLSESIKREAVVRFGPGAAVDGRPFQQSYEKTVGRTDLDGYLKEYLNQVNRIVHRVR